MYMLQLFDADEAIQPIDARLLQDGTLSIGRDPAADWQIVDPECALSRAHCELYAGPDGLSVRALGTNGVFDAVDDSRFPDGEITSVAVPGELRLGHFRIVATYAPHTADVDEGHTMILSPPLGWSVEVPCEWEEGQVPVHAAGGSLFEAFCQGAQLDSSQLSSEDPEEIMRRAGALYRQMVLGIGDLMAERSTARMHYELSRTTIAGEANNPFKWAPSQRLAIDLLLAGPSNFLSGPAALQACFRDLKRHLVATFAGLRASLRHAVESFSPASIQAAVASRSALLKSRSALHAEEVERRYAEFAAEVDDGAAGSLDRAFVAAYEQAESRLDRGEPA